MYKKNKNGVGLLKMPGNAKELQQLLNASSLYLSEFLTGILAPGLTIFGIHPQITLSAGHLVQSVVKRDLFEQLGREIKKYQEEGKIKEDYFATKKSRATLVEFLKFIDDEIPDEEVFNAMKGIFFSSIAMNVDEKQEQLTYQLLQICKKLASIDILILRSCFEIFQLDPNPYQGIRTYNDWVEIISKKTGLDFPELIGPEDEKLVTLGLLSRRSMPDNSEILQGKEFRLTRLGLKLCESITNWEE